MSIYYQKFINTGVHNLRSPMQLLHLLCCSQKLYPQTKTFEHCEYAGCIVFHIPKEFNRSLNYFRDTTVINFISATEPAF